jgi:hypothetical protein
MIEKTVFLPSVSDPQAHASLPTPFEQASQATRVPDVRMMAVIRSSLTGPSDALIMTSWPWGKACEMRPSPAVMLTKSIIQSIHNLPECIASGKLEDRPEP